MLVMSVVPLHRLGVKLKATAAKTDSAPTARGSYHILVDIDRNIVLGKTVFGGCLLCIDQGIPCSQGCS